MKKILCLILALVLCFTVFVACDNTQKEDPAATTLENATAYLKTMYKGYLTNPETPADYELVTSLMVDGQTYTVEWSVDNEAVKVVVAEDGSKVTVDIDEKSTAVAEYNLTAVVTAPDGTKGDPLTFKLKVPSANFLPIADALKAEDGTFVTVSGTVVLINTPWDDGYKNITVTIEDENGDQLYLYRLSAKVEVGDVLMVKGEMATYNGNRQMAQGCTAEIIGKEEVKTEYTEMTIPEALAADDNTLVCVKGTVKIINTAWSDQYKNISVTIVDEDGNELYLYRLSTKVEQGDVLTVKGVMATYNGNRQIAQGATAEITGKQDIVLVYEEKTIPEVLALADGALVCVQGTVKSVDTEWSDDYKNISVTIVDADGNELYLYRLATKVQAGDTLTVKGIVGSYEGKKQIVSGTAEIGSAHGDNHVYTNDCDVDCDICGAERTPKDHVYDNACDVDCNVCDAEREVAHKYDSVCDAECNVCGAKREVLGHEYSNNCDPDCNLCGEKRETAHVYKNACDADCDVCGAKRNVADHVYDNACDVDCNECGEKREAAAHVYDNACDADCNVCGAKRETSHTTVAECDEECDVCGAKIENAAEHTWSAECDKNCDKCNESRPVDCKDADDDGKCDYCEAVVDTATIEKGHIEYEAGKIKFNDVHVSGEATLPAVGAGYADVAITWTVDNADVAKIADGKVIFTAGTEDVAVTLTATFVCGGTTETKTYTVKVTVHAYDNACDSDCNVCPATREVEGHKYDDCTDVECNTCGTKREAQEHDYENACASKCSKCGFEREVEGHKYANCDAVVCSECNEPRIAPGHTFSNDCDAECNVCGTTRTPKDHVYSGVCDADCNVCGATREAEPHIYDNCEDADCNVCSATRTPGTCKDDNGDEKCDACGRSLAVAPAVGTPYKMYLAQAGLGKILYFKGEMNGYYFATTEDPNEAVDVYVETAEGGVYLYFMKEGNKSYLAIVRAMGTDNKEHDNAIMDAATPSVFVFNSELNTYTTKVGEDTLYFGSYGTHATIGASSIEDADTNYACGLTAVAIDPATCTHNFKDATCNTPKTCKICLTTSGDKLGHTEANTEGKCDRCGTLLNVGEDGNLSISDAIALGSSKEHDNYTDEKYYVIGVIKEIYNTQYGNMRIADENGNILTIYGTYSADGSQRFDAMTSKPAVGDTVKLYGIIGQYSNTPQMKNGWIVEVTSGHTHVYTEASCTSPKTCKLCGATDGAVLDHTYVDGACSSCGMSQPTGNETTVTFDVPTYGAANSLVKGTKYETFTIDGVTFTAAGTDAYTGKYYEATSKAPASWRFYSSGNATLTITAPAGSTIKSVKIVWSEGALSYNGAALTSGIAIATSGNSVVINATAKTFINSIEVVYE